MDTNPEPRTLTTQKPKPKIRTGDALFFGALVVVVAVIALVVMNELHARQDMANGKLVADKVVADIAQRDGASARQLGTPKFRSMYTDSQLTAQFRAITPVTSHARSVDNQVLRQTSTGKTAYIIYKYPTKDLAFYIRVAIDQNTKTHQWQLASITGNANESLLLVK